MGNNDEKIEPTKEQGKTESQKPELEQDNNHKISIKIKAKTKNFGISVETDSSINQLAFLTDKITKSIMQSQTFSKVNLENMPEIELLSKPTESDSHNTSDVQNQIQLFANRIGVDPEKLEKSKLIGIRDQDIQIIKVSQITPLEASMLILAIKDLVMNVKPIAYDDWKEICEANGIRPKTPLYKLSNNAKDRDYLNKSKYASKELLLTPKGIDFVKKSLEKFLK